MIKVKNSITEKDCIAYINKRYLFYCIAGIVFGFLLIGFICLRFLLSLKIWQKGMLDAFALTSMIFALMMPAIYFFTRRGLMLGIKYAARQIYYRFEDDYIRIDAYGDYSETHCKKSYSEIEKFGKLNSGIHFMGVYFISMGSLYIVKPQSIEQENEIYALLEKSAVK